MNEEIEWIRADHVPARLNWPDDNLAQHVQLLNGLKNGRIAARADNANTQAVEEIIGHLGPRTTECSWEDWIVPKSVWRDYPYHLYLRGRQYKYALDPHSHSMRFKKGDWVSIELTGLSFSLSELMRELEPAEPAPLVVAQAASVVAPKGAPPSELWKNFAAALVALQTQKPSFDVNGPRKTMHKEVADYAMLFGLEIPSLNTVSASLDRLKAMMACEHDDDGRPINAPDLSEKVS